MKRVLIVIAGVALASAAHTLTPPRYELWHAIFQRLYYLPVVFAAVAFGGAAGCLPQRCLACFASPPGPPTPTTS